MDPFGEKLEHLKARYAGEPSMPPHVVLDLLASLHAEVHQVSLDLSVALDGVTRLDDNVTLKDLIDKDHRVRARIYHRLGLSIYPDERVNKLEASQLDVERGGA